MHLEDPAYPVMTPEMYQTYVGGLRTGQDLMSGLRMMRPQRMMSELMMQTMTWMTERMIIDHARVFLLMLLTYAFSFSFTLLLLFWNNLISFGTLYF